MPALILPLVDAASHLPARGALLGLDLGTKTIGVATSDPDRRLATGVETVVRKSFSADAARLLALAQERLRAISASSPTFRLRCGMSGSRPPRSSAS